MPDICASDYCQSYPYQCNILYGCPLPPPPPPRPEEVEPQVIPPPIVPPPPLPLPPIMPNPDDLALHITSTFDKLENELRTHSLHPNPQIVLEATNILNQLGMHNEALRFSDTLFNTIAENDLSFTNVRLLHQAGDVRIKTLKALGRNDQAFEVELVLKPITRYFERLRLENG